MNAWQQKVWDYSKSGTGPDDGYRMRLMACQWIGSLEVTAFPPKSRGGDRPETDAPRQREFGALKGPMKVQATSWSPSRHVQRAEREPAPQPRKPLPPTSEHKDNDQKGTRNGDPCVWRDPDAVTEPTGPRSASADVAGALFEPPPGLDVPANVSSWPVWQFEQDPRINKWMAMNQALNWHLEESFQRGVGEATFCLGVNYYFDLRAMYQENPNTGTERRIRRRVF